MRFHFLCLALLHSAAYFIHISRILFYFFIGISNSFNRVRDRCFKEILWSKQKEGNSYCITRHTHLYTVCVSFFTVLYMQYASLLPITMVLNFVGIVVRNEWKIYMRKKFLSKRLSNERTFVYDGMGLVSVSPGSQLSLKWRKSF